VPLVVDVDGTLLRTDLLHEAALQFVARTPLESWRLAAWTLGGKTRLKTALADRGDPGIEHVPLREEVVALIRQAQQEGRPVYLASASDRRYVELVAERIGGIAGVFATDAQTNLSGTAKAELLCREFGERGYDYIGNHNVDMPIWRNCREALVVADRPGFGRRVQAQLPESRLVGGTPTQLRHYIRALRPHQWAKNLLIFLPLLAGHSFDSNSIGRSLIAFLCFCLAASSAYLINDVLDLPGDREHPRKRNRPFASGAIPVWHGPVLAALLMAGAFAASAALPLWFVGVLALYVTTTLAYSLFLKRKVLIDVIVLGALYTVRVLGGVAAVGVEQSPWLLMFSLFLFLGLAIVKRCSELVARRAEGKLATAGRGYHLEDLNILLALGAASAYGAVLVVALYIGSPEVQELYRHPERLWLICPLLLYWTSRVLILSNRNELHDDPVIFALTDRVSWVIGAMCVAIIFTAI
jgi:4-hydroxybenzoate polyprenyltransferase/phosphoserine phosphatase